MATILPFNRYTSAVWRRHVLVWRELFWPSMATNVANPLLFLFAYGFGLGAFVKTMGGLDYLTFVVPGMMAQAVMFGASFEATASAFSRFQMQKTWDAMLATPVTVRELVFAEALWAATKAVFAGFCVMVVGAVVGGVHSLGGALLALPVMALAGVCFAACGLVATVHAKSWDFFNYFFTFWITPMFVFSGVFFDIRGYPPALHALALLLPATHMIEVLRPLTSGQPLALAPALGHLLFLVVLGLVALEITVRRLTRRMFD